MEISYLDYEMYLTYKENEEKKEIPNGEVIYDPNNHCLLFNSKNSKIQFTIPIDLIQIKEQYLTVDRIVFDYKYNEKDYEIHIFSSKFDVLCKKTIKILNNILLKKEIKKQKYLNASKKYKDIIISEQKDYQKEMLEEAKKKNIIIFLETGMGKTFISILLIKEIFGEPREINRQNIKEYKKKTSKKILFLFKKYLFYFNNQK